MPPPNKKIRQIDGQMKLKFNTSKSTLSPDPEGMSNVKHLFDLHNKIMSICAVHT